MKITSNINNYRPKASLTLRSVNSLVIFAVNYYGTQIRTTKFWALLSTFTNINKLKLSFSAQITLTETIAYKVISDLPIVDLVLFPVSIDPPNLMYLKMINLTESHCNLLFNPIYHDKGFNIDPIYYSIQTSKVSGQLFAYSFRPNCFMNAPDEQEGQILRGISFYFVDMESLVLRNIQGMITLDDDETEKSSFILNYIKTAFNFIKEINKLNNHKNLRKRAHSSLSRHAKDGDEDDEDGDSTIKFIGNWEKVSLVEGKLEINTAKEPAVIKEILSVVSSVLDVQSLDSITLEVSSGRINFNQTQFVDDVKTISIEGSETQVSFTNITFGGSSPRLSLVIGGEASKIQAIQVTVESGASASISGGLEVVDIELGVESSLSAESGSSSMRDGCLALLYSLAKPFAVVPDFVEPNSIVLNDVGENEAAVQYSTFVGTAKPIREFEGRDHKSRCSEWLSRCSLTSVLYPKFPGDSRIVRPICIEESSKTTLALNVTQAAEGDIIVEEPEEPDDSSNEQPTQEKSVSDSEHNVDPSFVFTSEEGNNGGADSDDRNDNDKNVGDGLSVGAIAGIVVAVVVVVIAVVALLVWTLVIKKKKTKSESSIDEGGTFKKPDEEIKKDENNKEINEKRENNDNSSDYSTDDYDFFL